MADVFISYARPTAEVAQAIARMLRDEGYSVWIDDALPLHREFASVIEENVREAKAVLVLWSPEGRASRWVPAEADLAHESGTLVQLSLDGAPPPFPFNRLHCEMAAGWRGDPNATAWRKVLDSITVLARCGSTHGARPALRARDEPVPERSRPAERLLGVLAFDNLSGDQDLADFCDGISEEIQQTVAQGAGLRVVARSSSFQFRGKDKAVATVAAALGTTHLLDGSVRRSGLRVRIGAQLIDCASGSTLWANRFDGDLSDVFALQDRIAAAVAEALQVTLTPSAPVAPLNPEIYELFLRARGMITEGNRLFDDVAPEATPLLEQVVEGAPHYAPAWELLALSRVWTLRAKHRPNDFVSGRVGVLKAVNAALRLDPKRGGAYVALSMLEPWGEYAVRERLLRHALDSAPNDPGALTEMSTFCWSVGRFNDALAFAERACEINPLMPSALMQVSQMRYYVGDQDGAIRMLADLHRRWPKNPSILVALISYAAMGGFWDVYDEVAAEQPLFDGLHGIQIQESWKYGDALRGREPGQREARLEQYIGLSKIHGYLPLNLVEAISQFGFVDEAMSVAMESEYAVFDPSAPLPGSAYPGVILGRWSALNKNPRFIDLCDKLGLSAYWISSGCWPDCAAWTAYDFKAEVRRHSGAKIN